MFGKKSQNDFKNDYSMYVLFDSKGQIYREPMLALHDEDMIRQVENLFRDPKQEMNILVTNPEDFAIFKIGEWSKTTGAIQAQNHQHVANLHDLRISVMRKIKAIQDLQKESYPQVGMSTT